MSRQTSLLQQPSQQEAQPNQQYQQFLEAADRLGPHLESLFRNGFVQIVSPSRDKRAEVRVRRKPAVNPGALVPPQHATPSNWQDTRLHFVEAMMVLLFNPLDEKQHSLLPQRARLLCENLSYVVAQLQRRID